MKDARRLGELGSVGPAMLRDFERLGVRSVAQLARRNPERLYEELCRRTGQSQDLCVLDTFRAAVAQARNPRLPAEQKNWWYWSRLRKARESKRRPTRRRS
ncbi:MAG: helix-hairpin-helix domain-containing protein [Candidatus Acidiferrales bacterium]